MDGETKIMVGIGIVVSMVGAGCAVCQSSRINELEKNTSVLSKYSDYIANVINNHFDLYDENLSKIDSNFNDLYDRVSTLESTVLKQLDTINELENAVRNKEGN